MQKVSHMLTPIPQQLHYIGRLMSLSSNLLSLSMVLRGVRILHFGNFVYLLLVNSPLFSFFHFHIVIWNLPLTYRMFNQYGQSEFFFISYSLLIQMRDHSLSRGFNENFLHNRTFLRSKSHKPFCFFVILIPSFFFGHCHQTSQRCTSSEFT